MERGMEWNPANEIFYFAGHQLLLSDRRLSGNCFNSDSIRVFANVRFESSSLRFVEMEFGDWKLMIVRRGMFSSFLLLSGFYLKISLFFERV